MSARGSVTWTSDDPGIASVVGSGQGATVTAGLVGTTTVRAQVDGASAAASVTVTPGPVADVTVSTPELNLAGGETATVSAAARDAGGNALSGRAVTWTTSNGGVAEIVSTSGDEATIRGAGPGSATLTATIGDFFATISVEVTPGAPDAVSVSPSEATLVAGESTDLTAMVTDPTGFVLDPSVVEWSSSDASVATVADNGDGTAVVSAVADGSATITATAGSVTGQAAITVTTVPVAGVTVQPATSQVRSAETATLTAVLTDASGNTLGGRVVTWSSSDPTVLAIESSAGSTATVRGAQAGSVTVTATSEGVQGTATVTVVAGDAAVITLDPVSANLTVGTSFELTASIADAAGNVVQGAPDWSSSDTDVVVIGAESGLKATINGVAEGTASVTAALDGVQATAAVTVTSVPVASVGVSPSTVTLEPGDQQTLTATIRDADGNVLTGRPLAWTTSASSVATVTDNADGTATVTAQAVGGATITAASGGVSGTSAVTVQLSPVASVGVSPSSETIEPGATTTLTVTLRDADGNTLSGRAVTWSSSNGSVASVSDNGDGTATVAGNADGTATITATSEGQSGTSSITVRTGGVAMAWAYVSETGGVLDATNLVDGGTVTASRVGTGVYDLTFTKVSLISDAVTFHVTAHAWAPPTFLAVPRATCFLVGFANGATDATARVKCRAVDDGADQDVNVRVTVIGDNVLAGTGAPSQRMMFGFHSPGGATGPYNASALYSWSSGGGSVSISTQQGPGNVFFNHDASIRQPWAYFFTRLGGAHLTACEVSSGESNSIQATCRDQAGAGRIPQLLTLGFEQGRPGTQWAYALVQSNATLWQSFSSNPQGTTTITKLATGKYKVVFGGTSFAGAAPAVLLTPVINGGFRECAQFVQSFDPVEIDVACWDGSSNFADTRFNLAFLR